MAVFLYFIVRITTFFIFDDQICCTARIRTRCNKFVINKHFPRYRSSNMPKFNILKPWKGGKSLEAKWTSDIIAGTQKQRYNLVVHLAILNAWNTRK